MTKKTSPRKTKLKTSSKSSVKRQSDKNNRSLPSVVHDNSQVSKGKKERIDVAKGKQNKPKDVVVGSKRVAQTELVYEHEETESDKDDQGEELDSGKEIPEETDDVDAHRSDYTGLSLSLAGSHIDIAGNRSGTITKLAVPASVVSFDRTKKRWGIVFIMLTYAFIIWEAVFLFCTQLFYILKAM